MQDALFFQATYPWDPVGQARTHSQPLINPYLTASQQSNMVPLNQRSTIESDLYTGVEAWDYQNPNSFMAAGLLTIPVYASTPLVADTSASIQANITAHQGELLK